MEECFHFQVNNVMVVKELCRLIGKSAGSHHNRKEESSTGISREKEGGCFSEKDMLLRTWCVWNEKKSNTAISGTNTKTCSDLFTVNCDKNFTNTFSLLQQSCFWVCSDLQCATSSEPQQLFPSRQLSASVNIPVFWSLLWQKCCVMVIPVVSKTIKAARKIFDAVFNRFL